MRVGCLVVFAIALAAAEPGDAAARFAASASAGRYDAEAARALDADGMAAALDLAARLDEARPRQADLLVEAIARLAQARGQAEALLRAFDPTAHRIFYTDAGQQERFAVCLRWQRWPPSAAQALVRAAPVPTLAWLAAQARADEPDSAHVVLVVGAWAVWTRLGRERQHGAQLRRTLAALAQHPALRRQPATRAALVRACGDAQATEATEACVAAAADDDVGVRGEAVAALGRIGGDAALVAVAAAAADRDTAVAVRAADALASWPRDARAGDAAAAILARSDPRARRAVARVLPGVHWQRRAELARTALRDDDGGVVAGGLEAVAADPTGIDADSVLALADDRAAPAPPLVEALGALRDPRATPRLAAWLQRERNPALAVQLVRALRAIGDAPAKAAIVQVLDGSLDPLPVEEAIAAIDALAVAEACPRLIALVDDLTAPVGVRLAALRALGAFAGSGAHDALVRAARDAPRLFVPPDGARGQAARDLVDEARIAAAVARLRGGDATAAADLRHLWDDGAAAARHHALEALAAHAIADPIIAEGLASDDAAVLSSAVDAARAVGASAYRRQLARLRDDRLLGHLDLAVDDHDLPGRIAAAAREAGL